MIDDHIVVFLPVPSLLFLVSEQNSLRSNARKELEGKRVKHQICKAVQEIVALGMEISLDNSIIAALVLMISLTITFMQYNFCRSRMAKAKNNVQKKEKEPQEHDERFETSKLC